MMPSDRTITALVELVLFEADRAGRHWDHAGVFAQLRGLVRDEPERPLDDLLSAACAAARDPRAQTPAAIGWAKYRPAQPSGPEPERCEHCNLTEDACARQQQQVAEEHRFAHDYRPKARRIPR